MSNIMFQSHTGNYALLFVEYRNIIPYKYIVITHTEYAIGICSFNWIHHIEEKVLQPLRVDELFICSYQYPLFNSLERAINCNLRMCQIPRLWCHHCKTYNCVIKTANYWLNMRVKKSHIFHNNSFC